MRTTHDALLEQYLGDVRKYPVLGREEEHELALEYRKTGSPVVAQKLVTGHLRLVVKLAREYARPGESLLDLVQEGNYGLLRALKKYDPTRGIRLSTYAAFWIRAYMLRWLLDNSRMVKFRGPTERKLFFGLERAKKKLEAQGKTPTAEAIADALEVDTADVQQMSARLSRSDLSLDEKIDEEGHSVIDLMPDDERGRPDRVIEEGELRERQLDTVRRFGTALSGRQKKIFEERVASDKPRTLQALADEMGLSRERVRQLEQELYDALKRAIGKVEALPLAA
jgi:RNA polymerase sigma-32 factor